MGDREFVKIIVYVPVTHAEQIRSALAMAGAGKWNKYDSCSFSVRGVGRFRPLKGADPFLGKEGKIEEVEEERIEAICPRELYKTVMAAVRAAHPYEEPAIEVIAVLDTASS